jgi:MarR family transcriptional regulator, organic hydroperoxide resistance regulator
LSYNSFMGAKDAKPIDGADYEAWGLLASLVYPPRLIDVARDLGLSPATLSTVIRLGEPQTMGEIAEMLRCDPSNVTGIADALEARALARRRPSEADRRVKALELTSKGQRLRQRALGVLSEPPEWLRALSAKDQRALRDLLRRAKNA